MAYYHAGPKGLTELKTLRQVIESGILSVEDAQELWLKKWNDWIEEDALLVHPTMDEVSLTESLDEAREIADLIDGQVYTVETEITRINEEGYPVCAGPVECNAI